MPDRPQTRAVVWGLAPPLLPLAVFTTGVSLAAILTM